MTLEQFKLKWDSFQSNASKSFGCFRNESYLHDVTLVSDDYKHIAAHKLVLSASSEFFKNMFQQTKQTQPIVCLEGVASADIQNILDYVYEGEVMIQHEHLERFLKIAERLKIDGLADVNVQENRKDGWKETVNENIIKELKDTFKENVDYGMKDTVKEEVYNIESYEPADTQPKKGGNRWITKIDTLDKRGDMSDKEHKQRLKESITRNADKTFSCNICGKNFTGQNPSHSAKRHVEVHMDAMDYYCALCGHTFRSKNSLKTHTCFRSK